MTKTQEEIKAERDKLREEIKSRIRITDICEMRRAKDGKTLVCPICGSGEHKDGAFNLTPDAKKYKCFSCGNGGDVINFYQNYKKVNHNQALKELKEKIGFVGEPSRVEKKGAKGNIPAEGVRRVASPLTAEELEKRKKYFEECNNRLFNPDNSGWPGMEYLLNRGIDVETMGKYGVGFDPKSDPAGAGFKTPRVIIPTSGGHYIARRIDGKKDCRVMNPKDVPIGFFNIDVLKRPNVQEVFICEGAIDALSFLTVGADVIGLNSKENLKRFIKGLEAKRPSHEITFIIAMDNDKAGREGAAALAEGLRRLGLPFFLSNDIYGDFKDANEALCKDREAFVAAVGDLKRNAAARPDNVSTYIDLFMGADMEHFNRERKTGFPSFDELTGGLYPGLYVLAAISSLGKTDWVLQLADQLAEQGEDVLFFSLEMSRLELVSRSIARTIAKEHTEKDISAVDVRKGRLPADVLSAVEVYQNSVEDRLSVIEANFEANISTIGDYIRKYIAKTRTRPVVIVDYLQIIQPRDEDVRKGKREAIDNTVSELKRISRELDTPFIVISSVNRMNYQTPIAFESLKESGNIEFSADVVLGMQLQCLNEPLFMEEKKSVEKRERVNEEKNANPRKIELVFLKNRYGESGRSVLFDYYPKKDTFVDMGIKDNKHTHRQKKAGRTL